MKKIITILFCCAVFTSAFAQTRSNEDYDRNRNENTTWNSDKQKGYEKDHRNNGNDKYQNTNSRNAQRDLQIQRITRQYDSRIQQVNYDRSLNRRQKQRAIAQLQAQKNEALKNVYVQYRNSNVYNERDKDYNRDNEYNNDYNRNNGYRK